jgi:glycosyltransferase involved in cell wall biosynthesis
MRLLFLNHNVAWSGGTFFRAYHLARFLARRGHDVTLVSISPKRRLRFSEQMMGGVRVVETPDFMWGSARSGWDPWDTLRRTLFVRSGDWDLIQAFDSRPAVALPAVAAHRRGIPLVMDWADWWGRGGTIEERQPGARLRSVIRPVETYFEEAFRTSANATTVISSALRSRAIDLGVPERSIACIPGGCDVERVQPQDKASCRGSLGLELKAPLVGYLGVLTRSDAALLTSTITEMRRLRRDCRFVLIGKHKAKLPPLDGLIETGFVPFEQMVTWLGACDVLLLPLKDTIASRGRWPSKINDYLAAGRPTVATAVGDVAALFEDYEIGRTATDEPRPLAEAALGLIDRDDELERLGLSARRLAETNLAWSCLAERLETHYSTVMSGGRLSPSFPAA